MESSSDIKITVFGKTDVGLIREHNEDNFLVANADTGLKTSAPEAVLELDAGGQRCAPPGVRRHGRRGGG